MHTTNRRSSSQPWAPVLGHPRPVRHGRPSSSPLPHLGGLGETQCVTPRQTCPGQRLRAQLAFKNSMVHGILQFTPSIAFRYVLHRCESQDIRCRESFNTQYWVHPLPCAGDPGTRRAHSSSCSLAQTAPGFVVASSSTPQRGAPPNVGRRGQ